MKTNVADTSIDAYYSNNKLSEHRRKILYCVEQNGSMCNLDISDKTNLPINVVTGAVFWLRKNDLLVFDRKDICPKTDMRVNYWITKREKGVQDEKGNPTLFTQEEVPTQAKPRTEAQTRKSDRRWAH